MTNAVIYARYSSSSQREESIEDQVREIKAYAKIADLDIIKIYADYATTGTNDNREQFQKMIRDAKKKQFQAVVVYKNDRFARNRYDAIMYKKVLHDQGVHVIAIKEPIPEGPGGILLESIYESMAEMYSTNLAENIRRGQYGNATKCIANGPAHFGYKIDKITRHYEINEETAPIVRKIFEMCIGSGTYEDIRKYLKTQGYTLSNNGIYKILHNRRYLGIYIYGKVEVENGMPRIIDEDTFKKAQAKLARRATHQDHKEMTYLLSVNVNINLYKKWKIIMYKFNGSSLLPCE